MLPRDRVQATAGGEPVPVVDSVHRRSPAPLLLRPVLALFAVAFLPWLLGPISVYRACAPDGLAVRGRVRHVDLLVIDLDRGARQQRQRQRGTGAIGWWLAMMATPSRSPRSPRPPVSRWFVPCRTVAWALLWSFPVGILIIQAWWQHAQVGAIAAWVIAAAVIGWRAAKGSQEARMFGPDGVLAAYADPNAPPPAPPAGPASPPGPRPGGPARRPARPVPRAGNTGPAGPAGYAPPSTARGRRASPRCTPTVGPQAAAGGRGGRARAADHPRGRAGRARRDGRARAGQGAGPLDLRVDRGGPPPGGGRLDRQADAALRFPRPARHRQDHRSPGDRQIFYSFGLLDSPEVVEAQRSDLVASTWARRRSRPTSLSTPRSAGCCSSTRPTAW